MTLTEDWHKRIGHQRDWVWRGWQTRYTYLRSPGGYNPTNPPLMLLHGFGAAIEHWRNNIPVLSQEHTVYALDFLGFGASRKVVTDYNINLWLEQIHDFWQAFIRQPMVLVGNSLGSLVCLLAAATYPEMVRGIVMVNLPDLSLRRGTFPEPLQPFYPLVDTLERSVALLLPPAILKLLFRVVRRREVIRWLLSNLAYFDAARISDELVEIISAPPQDEGAEEAFYALFKSQKATHSFPSAQEILPNLTLPMLLIWGLQDKIVPPSLAPKLAKLNPNLKLIELDRASHCPQDECPEHFNAIVLDWLQANL